MLFRSQMDMDFMIWQGMFGNGAIPRRGLTGPSVAGVGASSQTTCVAAARAGTTRTTAPTTLGFVLSAVEYHINIP